MDRHLNVISPAQKLSCLFPLAPSLPKKSSCAFFKPSSLRMQLLSGSCGATSHTQIFSIVLGNYRSQCQVVEDIFYCHSIWLPGWLLCQLCCWLWSYLCSCYIFNSWYFVPICCFPFSPFNCFEHFPCVINTSLCNFHEFKMQNFPKMAFLSGYIPRVHPRTHLWHSWVFPHGFMTYGICSKSNHIFC